LSQGNPTVICETEHLAALCAGQIFNGFIGAAPNRFVAALLVASLLVGVLPFGFHLTSKTIEYMKQGINPSVALLKTLFFYLDFGHFE
jgi:hypothetical protein